MNFPSSQFALLHAKILLLIVSIVFYICIFSFSSDNRKIALPYTHTDVNSKLVEVRSLVNKQVEQRDWQLLDHPQLKFWIYSAYSFDEQQVVIIGSTLPFPQGQDNVVHCLFYCSQDPETRVEKVRGRIERMVGWAPKTAATFIRCPLGTGFKIGASHSKPTFVSVLLGNQSRSELRIPIVHRTFEAPPTFRISVCVLPLYGYNEVFHFLEWLEFYKIMGVEHFTFYNRSIGPATSCIMNHYKNSFDGVQVTVNPWHGYPQKNDSDIRVGVGLSAATNECWYSHKGLSKYLVFVDVDEFIVPNENISDYHRLINYLESSSSVGLQSGHKIGEFVFRNGFYLKSRERDPLLQKRCAKLKRDSAEFHACQNLWTMQLVEREPLSAWQSRTKYIGKPDAVKNGGNHYVHEFEAGWEGRRVNESVAFSRHYRHFEEGPSAKIERIPRKLGISLAKDVVEKVKHFMKVCGLNDADVIQ